MKKQLIFACVLIAWCALLVKVMVFKDLPIIRIGHLIFRFGGTQEGPANLVPFKTILPYLQGEKGWLIGGLNLAGNILLLVPVGFFVPFIFRNMTWKKALIPAVASGLAIEGMQVVFHVGIFDIDDVILNGLGVMLGYWVFVFFTGMRHSYKAKKIIQPVVLILTAAAFTFAHRLILFALC